MNLGAFSISLAVKDITVSKAFYKKLGFSIFGGDISQKWLILNNGATTIGLFQGMFPTNTLTFNSGWDSNANNLNKFTDIRELQCRLKEQGIEFNQKKQTKVPPVPRVLCCWILMTIRLWLISMCKIYFN